MRPAVRRGCVAPADPCIQLLSASLVGDSMEHAANAMSNITPRRRAASTKPAFVGDVELMLGCCGAFFVNAVTTV